MGDVKRGASAKSHRDILQAILDKRKVIMIKNAATTEAFNFGAVALERLNSSGANYTHEAGIMRYHASQPGAYLLQDQYTRRAIEAAIFAIDRMMERSGEK